MVLGLAQYLATLSSLVKNQLHSSWLVAEISELKQQRHAYLTLVEHNAQGQLVARCNACIWGAQWTAIQRKFQQATDNTITAGIKVMLKISANFHLVYGFSLVVSDIDPSYTLGDLSRKLQQIRDKLVALAVYECNQQLPLPLDFTSLTVIAPEQAAGLGDFRREADLLASLNLCKFHYRVAVFQGQDAAHSIQQQVQLAQQDPVDAIVILRGGGALIDLAYLNDLDLALQICNSDLPVMVGIGHQKDRTILDEIAAVSCDTPSKVINKIFHTITNNALAADQHWRSIQQLAMHRLTALATAIEQTYSSITANMQISIQNCEQQIKHWMEAILYHEPKRILRRGFVLARHNGSLLTSQQQAQQYSNLQLQFWDQTMEVYTKSE